MSTLNIISNQIENEIWKDILNYEGIYQASNIGNIRSLDREVENTRYKGKVRRLKGTVLNPNTNNAGYYGITLSIPTVSKRLYVHRLVCSTFNDNPTNLPQVNHKDGNKLNNKASNLEWCTNGYNEKHAYDNGLKKAAWAGKTGGTHNTAKAILQYSTNGEFIKEWDCIKTAADSLLIDRSLISKVCKGKRNHTGGFNFKYKNI